MSSTAASGGATELIPGSPFQGSGGSAVELGTSAFGLVTGVTAATAGEVLPSSEFQGTGGSDTELGGGAVEAGPFRSLDTWHELTIELGRRGPARLEQSRRLRADALQRFARLGPIG